MRRATVAFIGILLLSGARAGSGRGAGFRRHDATKREVAPGDRLLAEQLERMPGLVQPGGEPGTIHGTGVDGYTGTGGPTAATGAQVGTGGQHGGGAAQAHG